MFISFGFGWSGYDKMTRERNGQKYIFVYIIAPLEFKKPITDFYSNTQSDFNFCDQEIEMKSENDKKSITDYYSIFKFEGGYYY